MSRLLFFPSSFRRYFPETSYATASNFVAKTFCAQNVEIIPGSSRVFHTPLFTKSANEAFVGWWKAFIGHTVIYKRELNTVAKQIIPWEEMLKSKKDARNLTVRKTKLEDKALLEERCFTEEERMEFNKIEAELQKFYSLWVDQLRLRNVAFRYQKMIAQYQKKINALELK